MPESSPSFEQVVRFRRSVRKYLDRPVEPEKWEALEMAAVRAAEALDLQSVKFVFIRNPENKRKFALAAFSGIAGKINPWLLTTKAQGFIVLAGNERKIGDDLDNPLYLAEAAMAMEAVILQAAELGLGTCWMGAFGERKLNKVLKLPEGIRIVAISPVGYPPQAGPRLDWDTFTRQAVSKSRKPLDQIHRFMDEDR